MSYRLIDSNMLADRYPEVNDMPCIYLDLPNGLDNQHHGTVLPKGHGRLIDADAYKEKVFRIFPCSDRDDSNIRRATELCLGSAETIIEADKENDE